MKKTLLLLTSAALLLVGCAKEQLSNGLEGELTKVTFTASLESGVATKAAVDGDGAAANVNRCIMEIYYGDELFARQIEKVTDKHATFTAQVVSNRTYKVAFWADKVDATTEAGLQVDKYYTTNATGGLQAITINGDYIGNDDARDAFFHVGNYTVAQAGSSFGSGDDKILLKRPFAQMNVITTDWDKVKTIEALKPGKVSVTLKNPMVKFNAVTGVASADANTPSLEYTADVYVAPAPTGTAPATDKTLSMDYLFASDTKALIDIDWKALHGTDTPVAHAFAAVPYQRNYRTNIKGALLTTQGQWTVEVYPNWGNGTDSGEIDHPVVIATTLAEAQAAVGPASTGAEAAGTVIVKPEAIANRTADDEKGKSYVEGNTPGITLPEGAKAIEFVLTPQSKTDVTFELPALPSNDFYWYIRHEDNYPTKNLTVKVDDNDKTRVIIDAPNDTHVELNDAVYEHVIAITGYNTLVVPTGITVDKLTVKKGGVEIHGTVTELEIIGTEDEVFFRSCENLSQTVFAKIKGNQPTVHNYIDTPQYAEKLNSDGTYDIVSPVCKIDNSYFFSLSEAVATVGTEETTITMLRDIKFTESVNIGTKKIILNTNGMNLDATGLRAIEIYGGKLTVNGDGKFFAHSATGDNNAILNLYSGELVVNEVYLEGTNTCIGVTGGTATINNATMKALDGGCCVLATNDGVININGMIFTCAGDDPNGPGSCWARDGGTVNVYGGTFNAAPLNKVTHELETDQADYCLYDYFDAYPTKYAQTPGHIYVYGGTFKNFNPADNYSHYSFLAEGYQSVQDGNNWIVSAINN